MDRRRIPVVERLLSRISVDSSTGCWNWMGMSLPAGYGRIHTGIAGTTYHSALVHRVMYAHEHGCVPLGLVIDHLCCNPKCVNPDHLEAVTNGENILRGIYGHSCRRGHPHTAENGHYQRKYPTHWDCLACRRERDYGRQGSSHSSRRRRP